MSELRRGWWKDDRRVWTDAQGAFVRVSPEEYRHVKDMAAFIEGPCHMEHANNLLNRGAPPEPEPLTGRQAIEQVHSYLTNVFKAGWKDLPGQVDVVRSIIDRIPPELPEREGDPEPEWLPVGVAPDREGRWERMNRNKANEFLAVSKRGQGFWASFESGGGAPVDWLIHTGKRYRRIGDL